MYNLYNLQTYFKRLSTFRLPLTQSVSCKVISGVPNSALSTASTPSMNYEAVSRSFLPETKDDPQNDLGYRTRTSSFRISLGNESRTLVEALGGCS